MSAPREFRGKCSNAREWVYGNFLHDYGFQGDSIRGFRDGDTKGDIFPVDLDTIGQWTGMTDKNGAKVYEGDVIKGKSNRLFCVEYCQDICSYVARRTDGDLATPGMNSGTMKRYEVIGNIHDNPELMGGTENG